MYLSLRDSSFQSNSCCSKICYYIIKKKYVVVFLSKHFISMTEETPPPSVSTKEASPPLPLIDSSAQDVISWMESIVTAHSNKYSYAVLQSFEKFPWSLLLESSKRKIYMQKTFQTLLHLMCMKISRYGLPLFDHTIKSIFAAVEEFDLSEASERRRFTLLCCFTSDFLIASVTIFNTENDLLTSFTKSKSYIDKCHHNVVHFVITVLIMVTDYHCEYPTGSVGADRIKDRKDHIIANAKARTLHHPKGDSATRAKAVTKCLWTYLIELENAIQMRDKPNEQLTQLLDETVCRLLSPLLDPENDPLAKMLFHHGMEFIEIFAGLRSSRRYLALHYVLFALSQKGEKVDGFLRSEIRQDITQKRFLRATNYVLFLSSYCARAEICLVVEHLKLQLEFLEEIYAEIDQIMQRTEQLLALRHALMQSRMYLLYVQHNRSNDIAKDEWPMLSKAMGSIDLRCISPAVLEHYMPISEYSDHKNTEFVENPGDVQEALSWFPFDPCRLINLWDLVRENGYCYVLGAKK